jgi:hypothetical protein
MRNDPIQGDPKVDPAFSFAYRGFEFHCSAEPMGPDVYRPVVVLRKSPSGMTELTLPSDTDEVGYATRQEALRHAEQQAVRWVHDRTGVGQLQF